ncbi:MgtC/SapB family protein [Bartonella sp. HY329]|uniref:MgtC/SapB family protein n=1 Tax=unclassified Bartonella TaxID=2645622 RepID=UPI0021C8C615|nr:MULTISPECIES: MgtC/SapB family protein [unclassified Bartonella]UXM96143.1 MgtC/SapB family protein [Bartonella sp. HY329]UXN10467.1 MgtC/SapB family protein [Bartonella sp. HY328]
MKFTETFALLPFLDTAICLLTAFVLGTLIGAERQYRQRTAGLRTNVLVAVGAAAFVDLGHRLAGNAEAVRVISYVVSGIGFLGAGVIMKEGMNVRGLNTAATLWCSAAVGSCAGGDMLAEAALLTFFVIFGNTVLRRLVNLINRIPLNEETGEATYEIRLTVNRDSAPELREKMVDLLEKAQYPVSDVEIYDLSGDRVELIATLVSTAIDKDEIEAVVNVLEKERNVHHANWESSTRE